MSIRRIAIVFDDSIRPETTGGYCHRALSRLAHVEHFLPTQLPKLAPGAFDLFLRIDDGLPYELPSSLHPSAFWAIDTHLEFDRCLSQAKRCDFVCSAQLDGCAQLARHGLSPTWLPLACDPEVHRPHGVPIEHDLAFIGHLLGEERLELLSLLQRHFRNCYVGQHYFDDMAKRLSATKIAFNRSVRNDLNMRVFEVLGCGPLLLTNDLSDNGQDELFRDGVHLATYGCAEELVDKAEYYLRHDDLRRRIALAGHNEAVGKHTYAHRMETIIHSIEREFARTVASAPSVEFVVDDYFDHVRQDVLELVPRQAKRILDVGCGAGRLGQVLKNRQQAHVTGIESNPTAANIAQRRLDRTIRADIEAWTEGFPKHSFDTVICADILEHLADPRGLLRRVHDWLVPAGTLVLSIPNVRHHSVIKSLLAGNWSYEPAGLLDDTHLQFFTRSGIEELLRDAAFSASTFTSTRLDGDAPREQAGTTTLDLGSLVVQGLPQKEVDEFYAYQWLVTAKPVPATSWPRCRVLMVTYNRLEYTRLAIDALLQIDYPDWELVVWDNASTDGTVAYLRERLAGVPSARLVESFHNVGVVQPMNEVWFADPMPEILAKVDNDTRVPEDWLRRLVACHLRSSKLGVLSGFHFRQEGENVVSPEQVREAVGVALFAQPYVGGCSVTVRRDVLNACGPIPVTTRGASCPVMDSGWTLYQQRICERGYVNGYPWPPLHVDHMEDGRSRWCIRSPEHQEYKQQLRGMSIEQFTESLCVLRPNSLPDNAPASAAMETRRLESTSFARMRFRQDFGRDYDEFDFLGDPFAFVRFGDGERGICLGERQKCADGWVYPGGKSRFADALLAALQCDLDGYYIGISDSCCDRTSHDWYLAQVKLPLDRMTFANIFVNANYSRFRQIDLRPFAIVASQGGDVSVPENVFECEVDVDSLVDDLLRIDRPILVSAGPLAKILIHEYWRRARRPQAIVDVGSALDERLKGGRTRGYHFPGSRTSNLVCSW